jgi:hypothetical protein
MKALITLVLIVGIYLVGRSIMNQYRAKQQKENPEQAEVVKQLEGVPSQLEVSLQNATAAGAPALKTWLQHNRKYCRDPRLAEIELDYVVLVSRTNPNEAKKVFQSVKRRTPKTSPVYEDVKRLEATYGN